jgi:hypothetical protein
MIRSFKIKTVGSKIHRAPKVFKKKPKRKKEVTHGEEK